MAPPLPGDRDDGEGEDGEDRGVDVVLEPGEGLAEEVAEQGDPEHPQSGADRAPQEEAAAVHPGDAGDDGDVGAHERHEAADDQRLAAVLVEERGGLVEVLALEDPAVALVERRADGAPDLVAEHVAAEGTDRQHDEGEDQVDLVGARDDLDLAAGDEQPHREQQAVTGQEREEQAALDDDDRQAHPEEPGAELVEQPLRVHPLDAEQEGQELAGHRPRVSAEVTRTCRCLG